MIAIFFDVIILDHGGGLRSQDKISAMTGPLIPLSKTKPNNRRVLNCLHLRLQYHELSRSHRGRRCRQIITGDDES